MKKIKNKNNPLKIMVVVGARPNFIKIAPLFWEFKKYPEIKPILVHTGQHYDDAMSRAFFKDLDIPEPNVNLGIGSGTHAAQTAVALIKLEEIMVKERPALAVVVGDVNSSLAAALAAAKLHIPVAHIEAGPRDFDMKKPEEVNRILIDRISEINFCPTIIAVDNLKNEGIVKGTYFAGDIMLDAFLALLEKVKKMEAAVLKKYGLVSGNYVLLTIHRQENADCPEKLGAIMEAMTESGRKVLFPVHPRTKKQLPAIIVALKNHKNFGNLRFVDPLGYIEVIVMEKNAEMICTDSGGIQKEAYWAKVPCVTLMETTGWPETVAGGWNTLAGADKKKILRCLTFKRDLKPQKNYFGRGDTAKKIIDIIVKKYADFGRIR